MKVVIMLVPVLNALSGFVPLQVYLGKWQETDVAIKVLTEIQNLSPQGGIHPQDPATLQPWSPGGEGGEGPQARHGGIKASHAGGLKDDTGDTYFICGIATWRDTRR